MLKLHLEVQIGFSQKERGQKHIPRREMAWAKEIDVRGCEHFEYYQRRSEWERVQELPGTPVSTPWYTNLTMASFLQKLKEGRNFREKIKAATYSPLSNKRYPILRIVPGSTRASTFPWFLTWAKRQLTRRSHSLGSKVLCVYTCLRVCVCV